MNIPLLHKPLVLELTLIYTSYTGADVTEALHEDLAVNQTQNMHPSGLLVVERCAVNGVLMFQMPQKPHPLDQETQRNGSTPSFSSHKTSDQKRVFFFFFCDEDPDV